MKLKPCPTMPGGKLTPPLIVPLLLPEMSAALPSPGHQAIIPDGGETQTSGDTTVRSLAVLLPVFRSPPPDTIATLVTEAGAFAATLTVSVIAGYVLAGASTS